MQHATCGHEDRIFPHCLHLLSVSVHLCVIQHPHEQAHFHRRRTPSYDLSSTMAREEHRSASPFIYRASTCIDIRTIPQDHTYASMSTRINFNKTDGDPATWPRCGRLQDGGRLDRLPPNDEHVALFLDKLAVQLAQLLGYPGR